MWVKDKYCHHIYDGNFTVEADRVLAETTLVRLYISCNFAQSFTSLDVGKKDLPNMFCIISELHQLMMDLTVPIACFESSNDPQLIVK